MWKVRVAKRQAIAIGTSESRNEGNGRRYNKQMKSTEKCILSHISKKE